jgi:hypothetical protein
MGRLPVSIVLENIQQSLVVRGLTSGVPIREEWLQFGI